MDPELKEHLNRIEEKANTTAENTGCTVLLLLIIAAGLFVFKCG